MWKNEKSGHKLSLKKDLNTLEIVTQKVNLKKLKKVCNHIAEGIRITSGCKRYIEGKKSIFSLRWKKIAKKKHNVVTRNVIREIRDQNVANKLGFFHKTIAENYSILARNVTCLQ